jgi:hypothetical protein
MAMGPVTGGSLPAEQQARTRVHPAVLNVGLGREVLVAEVPNELRQPRATAAG